MVTQRVLGALEVLGSLHRGGGVSQGVDEHFGGALGAGGGEIDIEAQHGIGGKRIGQSAVVPGAVDEVAFRGGGSCWRAWSA